MSNGNTPTAYDANVCLLADQAYAIGQKVAYQGRILYCAPPGAWIDYGPVDPVPLLDRCDPGAGKGPGTGDGDGDNGKKSS